MEPSGVPRLLASLQPSCGAHVALLVHKDGRTLARHPLEPDCPLPDTGEAWRQLQAPEAAGSLSCITPWDQEFWFFPVLDDRLLVLLFDAGTVPAGLSSRARQAARELDRILGEE